MSQEVIKSFKGFNPDFTCRGQQYEVGQEYEMPENSRIKVCESGFHACESPLEVLDHYFFTDNGEMCRFAEVEQIFVHQLQQFLRLCGIEKEIEL